MLEKMQDKKVLVLSFLEISIARTLNMQSCYTLLVRRFFCLLFVHETKCLILYADYWLIYACVSCTFCHNNFAKTNVDLLLTFVKMLLFFPSS